MYIYIYICRFVCSIGRIHRLHDATSRLVHVNISLSTWPESCVIIWIVLIFSFRPLPDSPCSLLDVHFFLLRGPNVDPGPTKMKCHDSVCSYMTNPLPKTWCCHKNHPVFLVVVMSQGPQSRPQKCRRCFIGMRQIGKILKLLQCV